MTQYLPILGLPPIAGGNGGGEPSTLQQAVRDALLRIASGEDEKEPEIPIRTTGDIGIPGFPLSAESLGRPTTFTPISDPLAQARINTARLRYIAGMPTLEDANILFSLNELSPTDIRKLQAGGFGEGEDAFAGARHAETVRQNRLSEAQAAINTLMARHQSANEAILSAVPYAIGGATHFPGATPSSYLVRQGLLDPVPVTGVPFDPERVYRAGGDEAGIAGSLALLRRIAGV